MTNNENEKLTESYDDPRLDIDKYGERYDDMYMKRMDELFEKWKREKVYEKSLSESE